ncbi:MAG: V-type ATPase 116kDa subunit family protein [bacterium]|nr:V-type ATPase 116kDa subunit family protein [bacterium]
MIVEMRRVLVFGPKRLLGGVVEEVQRIGSLHIDRVEAPDGSVSAVRLDEEASAAQAAIERAHHRASGLLILLPAVPPAPGDSAAASLADGDPSDSEALADPETLDAALAGIETEVAALTRRRLEAEEELDLIQTYESALRVLSPLLGALSGSRALESVGFILRGKDLSVVTSLRNHLSELTGGRIEVASRTIEEGKIGVVVAFLHRDAETIRGWLTRAGISELRLPARFSAEGPAEAVRQMERRRAELPGELAGITASLADVSRRHRPMVEALLALATDRLAQFRAMVHLAQSHYAFILHGWAPADRIAEVRGTLQARFGRDVLVQDLPADPHDAAAVPVMLDNPSVIRPFQRMLGLFKPPRYGTLDPTIYLAVFFPVFVGMVIGDVAYGSMLFALGWWMRGKARRGEAWDVALGSIKMGMRITPTVLADISWVIRVMATWVILFGVLYLEIFGNLIEHHFGWHPIFNRVTQATAFFYMTVAVGAVQVALGYFLHMVLAVRHRHLVGVLESLAMLCGVAALLLLLGGMGNIVPPSLMGLGVVLAGGFLAFFLVGVVLKPFSLMWLLEVISGMGNVLSYARLFGVGLAAAVLANVSNELGGAMGPVWVGVVAGMLIQMIFFAFTFAGHVIQPARLNWVEFLTKVKYHDETGNSYQPLHKTGGD